MNYQDLLKKYMAHVRDVEGVTYAESSLDRNEILAEPDRFTDEEWSELEHISRIVYNERTNYATDN